MNNNRYAYVRCGVRQGVLIAIFKDRENGVFTAKAVNLEDLEFLGGHATDEGAYEDAATELKSYTESE